MKIESSFCSDKFKDIRYGECFRASDGAVLMRLYPSVGCHYNAVDLYSGMLAELIEDAPVEKCEAKVTVNKKRSICEVIGVDES